jgi:DNA-binding FadR family transcriptional regulator
LEARGLVALRPGPGGGVFIASPSSRVRLNHFVLGFRMGDAPFSDCLVVRNALEPLVCREASRYAKPRDAAALRKVVERMEAALDQPAEFLRLNWELHRRLARMCRNVPLKGLYLTLLDYVENGLSSVEADEAFEAKDNLEVHRRLIEAVIDGDRKRLEKAIEDHMPMADRWVDAAT